MNTLDQGLLSDVEIRFDRQPVDVARLVMGVAFHMIDDAVIRAASVVAPGEAFTAEVPGWDIHGERSRERLVLVRKIVPARVKRDSGIAGFAVPAAHGSRLAS